MAEHLVERNANGKLVWTQYADELSKEHPEAIGEYARQLIWEAQQLRDARERDRDWKAQHDAPIWGSSTATMRGERSHGPSQPR